MPNGLRIVVVERHALPIVSMRLLLDRGLFDAGAPGELGALWGAVLQSGTATRSEEQLSGAYAAMGALHDLDVSVDAVSLWAKSGTADLDAALSLVSESVLHPRLDPASFAATRSRWMLGYGNASGRTEAYLWRNLSTLVFGPSHPYASPHLHPDASRAVTIEQVGALHALLFQPAYATLVVVGDTDMTTVQKSAAHWLGQWSSASKARPLAVIPAPAPTGPRVVLLQNDALAQTTIAVGAGGPAASDDDAPVIEIIARALGGLASPLGVELREERGASYTFGAPTVLRRGGSYFMVTGVVDSPRALPAIQAVLAAIRKVQSEGIPDSLLERTRTSLTSALRASLSTNDGVARLAIDAITRTGDLGLVERRRARLAAVTGADVRRVAARLLADDGLRVVVVGGRLGPKDLDGLGLGAVRRGDASDEKAP